MIIGIPKEIKNHESRVAVTPAGVQEFVKRNHTVYIERSAGVASGFRDSEFEDAGARILESPEEVFAASDMIIKVKEPVEKEYNLVRRGQIVFTYFHFASSQPLAEAMLASKAICIAYETVERADGSLPLLVPMSEVAGRMAVQEGAKYLEKPFMGMGKLLGGVPGVAAARVLILGGGVVGTNAAKIAAGMGAEVTITDLNVDRLRYLADVMPHNVKTLVSDDYTIRQLVTNHDLIIGAVLIAGAKAPKLIDREMLKTMRPGTVLVDVAVDQGGCIETCKPTTHESPIYVIDDVIHYCVANMPGAVPFTSTRALTNATLPYAIKIADHGWIKACLEQPDLRKGLNMFNGKIAHPAVSKAFGYDYTDPLVALSA